MILYAEDMECWYDESDPDFKIGMTPEGGTEDVPTFEHRHDFWKWYSNEVECPDFSTYDDFFDWYFGSGLWKIKGAKENV
jgi:hypothetical protein